MPDIVEMNQRDLISSFVSLLETENESEGRGGKYFSLSVVSLLLVF